MGLFRGLFGKENNENKGSGNEVPWVSLVSIAQLSELEANSSVRPQVIFKHSITCGVSRMVLNIFKSSYNLQPSQMDLYFLDLHANRDVSNAVAEKFDVVHQSPQLLIIKNGAVERHASHGAISEINLEDYLS